MPQVHRVATRWHRCVARHLPPVAMHRRAASRRGCQALAAAILHISSWCLDTSCGMRWFVRQSGPNEHPAFAGLCFQVQVIPFLCTCPHVPRSQGIEKKSIRELVSARTSSLVIRRVTPFVLGGLSATVHPWLSTGGRASQDLQASYVNVLFQVARGCSRLPCLAQETQAAWSEQGGDLAASAKLYIGPLVLLHFLVSLRQNHDTYQLNAARNGGLAHTTTQGAGAIGPWCRDQSLPVHIAWCTTDTQTGGHTFP